MARTQAARRGMRRALTWLMNVLVVLAVLMLIHLVIVFFGVLAGQPLARALVRITAHLVAPIGLPAIETPYGGVFAPDAAVTVFVLLVAEWMVAQLRRKV